MNRLVKEGIVRSEKAQLILSLIERELADLPDEYGDIFFTGQIYQSHLAGYGKYG